MEAVSASPDTAALKSMRTVVRYEDGEFRLEETRGHPRVRIPARQVVLVFRDESGDILETVSAGIPLHDRQRQAKIEAWFLTVQPWKLYHLEMPGDTVGISLPEDLGHGGCLTFTFPYENGFKATQTFVIKSH